MLQEAIDDRDDADVLADARQPRPQAQMPRQIRSMRTPAWLARYSACTIAGSSRPLILAMIRPSGRPSDVDLLLDLLDHERCIRLGATTSFFHCGSSQ